MTTEEAFEKLEVTVGVFLMSGNADNTYCREWREILETLKQEPCEDCISRKSIKHKLQEHHDFFVNAHGGFSNLPQNDKSRVDEIINCIAMVVNEPSVQPKTEQEQKTDRIECGTDGNPYKLTISNGKEYKQAPKADVLDKIRAEIKRLPYQRLFGKANNYFLLDKVIEIIDKYKESEG